MSNFDIKDLINCKYNIDGDYNDVSNSSQYIESSILDNVSPFNIYLNYLYPLDDEDKSIIQSAIDKWKSIILLKTSSNSFDLTISVYYYSNSPGVLAAARVDTINSSGIPLTGSLYINSDNWVSQKSFIKEDGNSQAYYTILHELGHLLGIGTLWSHLVSDNFYIGQYGVREYRNLLHQPNLTGIPIEDDGGDGTAGGHFEEGAEFVTSNNTRYDNGHFHTGLDRELMTGWAESDTGVEPLSRVSVGILQDLGFVVDYSKADPFFHESSGHLNSGEIITVQSNSYILNKETNYFYYKFETSSNYITISSSQFSILCSLYVRYQNEDNFYAVPLRVFKNNYVTTTSTVDITSEPVTLYVALPNKVLYDSVLFFRNR